MADFVLIHGAYHGAWCFELLEPELRAKGHRTCVTDLPCDDSDAGLTAYADAAIAAMDRDGITNPIVVGHSLGGFTVPLVAQRRSVRRLVFLCTAPVLGGERGDELRARMVTDDYRNAPRFFDAQGRALSTPSDAWKAFYADCPEDLAVRALARLRAQSQRPLTEPWPVEQWPDCPRSVILARHDAAVRFDAAYEAAKIILDGDEPHVLDGGHSPFYSRPAELAELLHMIAKE